jgi:hypothetical protein
VHHGEVGQPSKVRQHPPEAWRSCHPTSRATAAGSSGAASPAALAA